MSAGPNDASQSEVVDDGAGGCPMNRRRFLQTLGFGAAASAATLAPGNVGAALGATAQRLPNGFGRMFPTLPPFAPAGPALTAALLDIGKKGGIMDAKDDLSAGPVALIVDPALNLNNPNNPTQTAGTTFVGQFLAHDLTFDIGSVLDTPSDPGLATNGRTPELDLESLYGAGPMLSAHLYDTTDRAKFKVESGGVFEDLPRGSDLGAIIADPRNDENVVLSGMQAAFLKFHNNIVDYLRAKRTPPPDVFEGARRLATRHYQWMLVNEYLPQIVGRPLVRDILVNGRRFYRPRGGAAIPVEFQGAAFRFGHSQVRPSYRANMAGGADGGPVFGFIFDPDNNQGLADPDDFVGGFRGSRRFIGWQTFFDFSDGEVKPNKMIDTKISTPLFNLPLSAIAGGVGTVVLPQRTLLRHVTWSIPSGQDIAYAMHEPMLGAADFPELAGYGLGLDSRTPLWYYVLKEAEVMQGGLRLGPVGGRIVAEVLLGLMKMDNGSYLNARPRWRPSLPTRTGAVTGDFTMADILTFAGVDPTSRGQ